MTGINVFEEIKNRTDIKEVAERFGIQINKHGKSLCFVHSERNPSLSFKGNYFKCFSCGAGGDVIKMVCHIRGIQPIEAARLIDGIYGFNLFENKMNIPELKRQIKQIESDKQILAAFRKWEANAFLMLSDRYWELYKRRDMILKPDDKRLQTHISELAELPLLEYLLDEMIFNTSDINRQIEFYTLWKRTVEKYEQLYTTSRHSA